MRGLFIHIINKFKKSSVVNATNTMPSYGGHRIHPHGNKKIIPLGYEINGTHDQVGKFFSKFFSRKLLGAHGRM